MNLDDDGYCDGGCDDDDDGDDDYCSAVGYYGVVVDVGGGSYHAMLKLKIVDYYLEIYNHLKFVLRKRERHYSNWSHSSYYLWNR